MVTKRLEISLFGACVVRSCAADGYEVSGAKHKALFALLATAPMGRCTRAHLQDTLWGTACYDSGRQSLRRALSDIKRQMGDDFGQMITSTNSEITLDLSQVTFAGQPGRGTFLEGLNIRETGFVLWLEGIRSNASQIYSLYGPTSRSATQAVLPTISIVPFQMVFGDDKHAVLGDFLAEQICRSLSRSNLVAVISHLSARALTQSTVALADVRDTLAVDYYVQGSLRVIDGAMILDADFIDATSGRILWTRNFKGPIAEFMSGESAAEAEIVSTVGRTIASDAIAHTKGRALHEIEDHRLLISGVGQMHQLRFANFVDSRNLIEEAIRRAPQTAEAHAWLAEWYVMSIFNGWSANRDHDTQQAVDSTARALDIDPDNAFCMTIDGVVHNNLLQRLDIAEERFGSALRLNPNESMSWLLSGVLHAFRDEGGEAVSRVERARNLSPIDPFGYFYDSLSASAYLADEDYEQALLYADRSLALNDRHFSTLRARICALHYLGRDQDARTTASELMRRMPNFTVDGYLREHPASDHKLGRNVATAMRAAGIN